MRIQKPALARCSSGQALVETAILLPLLLMIIFNAVNFGYFFLVALNLAAAPRSGSEYSILGSQTPATLSLPSGSAVNAVTVGDMTGAISSPLNTPVQVCGKVAGCGTPPCLTDIGLTTQKAMCATFGNAASPAFSAADSDPESPHFVLQRVDVQYHFNPIIPGTPFGMTLLASPVCSSSGGTITCTFHRQVSMRAID
jgi:TadE-like protein